MKRNDGIRCYPIILEITNIKAHLLEPILLYYSIQLLLFLASITRQKTAKALPRHECAVAENAPGKQAIETAAVVA